MTLLDTYNGFIGALATGQLDRLPTFVDPDAYTEDCVGFTGWTQGLDVALANFQFGIGAAFADLAMDVRDVVESPGSVIIRARVSATHAGDVPRHRPDRPPGRVGLDRHGQTRAGRANRLAVQPQRLGRRPPPAARRTGRTRDPVRYAVQAPQGHPLAPASRESA